MCCENIFNDENAQRPTSTKDLGNWKKKKRSGGEQKKREILDGLEQGSRAGVSRAGVSGAGVSRAEGPDGPG